MKGSNKLKIHQVASPASAVVSIYIKSFLTFVWCIGDLIRFFGKTAAGNDILYVIGFLSEGKEYECMSTYYTHMRLCGKLE